MATRRFPRWLAVVGGIVVAIGLVIAFWNWDWFIPLVESRASAALGRKVSIAHMHVHLGRLTRVTFDDVVVENPPGFPAPVPLAKIDSLSAAIDVAGYLHNKAIRIPEIDIKHPVVEAQATKSGQSNYQLALGSSGGGPSPQIGAVRITDGHVHAVVPKLNADFNVDVATREGAQGHREDQIVADAKGTYAGQPITGHFVGGALLSLREASHPYPIDLQLANGPTRLSLKGTVQDPLKFEGADVKLDLRGADMADLYHLTGIPIPATPPYHVAGALDYDRQNNKIRFDHFAGTVGHSDLAGNIAIDPGKERPLLTADLLSRRVDLNDLAGFIGGTPGTPSEAATPQQRRAIEQAKASPGALPDKTFNLPKLKAADVRLRYRADHIEGRYMPLDQLVVNLDITDGNINLHPASFTVGKGAISANIAMEAPENVIHTKADVDFRRVDVARLMAATHLFEGAGTIGGRATIDTTGNSVAAMMGNGNGEVKLFMAGGDLSALLADLSGLEFGNALMSALGIPSRDPMRCMVIDMPLNRGVLTSKVLLIDTENHNIMGSGDIDFRNQTIDFELKTEPKHFTIGSLPAPIDVKGPLKKPSILPNPTELGVRGGIAAVLGTFLTPLAALLPTIQFGTAEDHNCRELITQASQTGRAKISPQELRARTHR
ncbi:MAG: AsmA family protein [Acetobacteraceae bacterium]|nr:AsmA family protein [Acetobacteraceae bacterium]